jgi:hypothetical protein
MSDADIRRFVPALRRAWDSLQAEAFSELGKGAITGAELCAYLRRSIEGRSERNRTVRDWNRLPARAQAEALLAAFPAESYSRRPPPNGRMG